MSDVSAKTTRLTASLTARLHVAHHRFGETGDTRPLEEVGAAVARSLGETDALWFRIAGHLEEIRSTSRGAADSAEAWRDLRERAERHLPVDHPTLMEIRALEARYAPRWSRPDELDRGVRMCADEYRRHLDRYGERHHRTRVTRANLAIALRDRAAAGDLDESNRVLREEAAERDARYGVDHPFAWEAHVLLARTLSRIAESSDAVASRPEVAEALGIVDRLVVAHRERFGRAHAATLRIHLLRAHLLSLSGRAPEAVTEIRYVRAAAVRAGDRAVICDAWADATPEGRSDPGPADPVPLIAIKRRRGSDHQRSAA